MNKKIKTKLTKEFRFLWKNFNTNIDFIPKSVNECYKFLDLDSYDSDLFEIFNVFYESTKRVKLTPSYRSNLPKVKEKRNRILKSIDIASRHLRDVDIDELKAIDTHDPRNGLFRFIQQVKIFILEHGEFKENEEDLIEVCAFDIIKNTSKFVMVYEELRVKNFTINDFMENKNV